jgi:hypothetical protein
MGATYPTQRPAQGPNGNLCTTSLTVFQSLGIQGRESKRSGHKAVGKSLVAQALPERLGVHHVDFDWALCGAGRSTA